VYYTRAWVHMQDGNTILKTLVGEKWSLYPKNKQT